MHILVVPSWYPNSYNQISGIFFKEQAEALSSANKVGVVAAIDISLKDIFAAKRLQLGRSRGLVNGVATYMLQYPSIPKFRALRVALKGQILIRLFKEYIAKEGLPDIVHLHSFEAGALALYIKKHFDIPYVVTEHSSVIERELISQSALNKIKTIYQNAACNVAVSSYLAKQLQKRYGFDFKVVPNIVDTSFFKPSKDKFEKFTFINVGFMNKNKNQKMLIEAFAKSFTTKDANLLIVGDGEEFGALKKLIKDLKMQDQITLFGRATKEQTRELMQKSHAFVLSSIFETFGVAAIEAMACGLPILATKCGGPEGIVTNSKLGILCEADTESLAQGLSRIYENASWYNAEYIWEYAVQNFSKEAVARRLNTLFIDVLQNEGSNFKEGIR